MANWFIHNEDTLEITVVTQVRNPHAAYKALSQVARDWGCPHTPIYRYVPTKDTTDFPSPGQRNPRNIIGRCNEGRVAV